MLPDKLNVIPPTLDAPVIERMGVSMGLPKRDCSKVAPGPDPPKRLAKGPDRC